MNGEVNGVTSAKRRTRSLAFACIVVWVIAAASTGPLGVWLAIGGAATALGVAVWVNDRTATRTILQPSPRLVLLGVAVGGLMALISYLLYPMLARIAPFIALDTARLYAVFRAPSLVIAAIALAPIVLGEELVWRGVVQAAMARRFGVGRGVVLAALVYAVAQAPLGSPVLVAVALLCGIAWGILRATTASLIPALVAHLVWDSLLLLWLPLDRR